MKMTSIESFAATVMLVTALSWTSFAQQPSGDSPPLLSHKETKARVKTGGTVAVFLTGNDALLTRITEDALAIHLAKQGFTVISREKLERSVGEQLDKSRKENKGGAINALDIGQAIGSDHVVTGTVVTEYGEQKSTLIRLASLQLVDVGSGQALVSVLFEPEKGETISEVTRKFAGLLK
jgi:hypothetical protein